VRPSHRLRRRLAYPIVTLCVAGVVFLFSRGQIASHAPAAPADYEAFAREVMREVRAGRPVPKSVDPAIQTVFDTMAPASVRADDGGELSFELIGPTDPGAGLPHIQSVVIRARDGAGVSLAISILGGRAEVVGVARVDRLSGGPQP